MQLNSCSDKRGEGEAHWKSVLSLPWEGLWGLITFPGCGGCRGCPNRRSWTLTGSAWTGKLLFVYILLIPLLQHSFGSAWIHRNFCSFISLETVLLVAKMPFVGPNLPLFEYPQDAQTQPCCLAPRETLPSHLISTEHPSQPLQFNYYPLAFDFLTRIYCTTEIAILFSNVMSLYRAHGRTSERRWEVSAPKLYVLSFEEAGLVGRELVFSQG